MKNEDLFAEFEKFAEGRNLDSEEEFDKAFDEFMKQRKVIPFAMPDDEENDVYDFLEKSENAQTQKQALKYAEKALALEPDNFDAQIAVAELSAKGSEELIKKYKELITAANKKMKAEGWFSEEYIGDFWGIYETRPYMHLRLSYLNALINFSMFKAAVAECEDLLRLCENDNLGVRYRLMHLFAYFEDETGALKLLEQYDEKSTMFLLPLSILYYKLGKFAKATSYLKELNRKNSDTVKLFDAAVNDNIGSILCEFDSDCYRPFTIEEFGIEFNENPYLFISVPEYFNWGAEKLKIKVRG